MLANNLINSARHGSYDGFIQFYRKEEINTVDPKSGANSLCLSFAKSENLEERLKIAHTLLDNGIDINCVDLRVRRNAMHWLFNGFLRCEPDVYLQLIKKMVAQGIDVNAQDVHGAIPLQYAITVNKRTTEEMTSVYQYLLSVGADYNIPDNSGLSCLDYANKFSWRNNFIKIVEEFNEHK